MEEILYIKPECIERLGESIFIKLPLYELEIPLEPIYINDQLFNDFLYDESWWDNKYYFIKKLFSVTLNKTLSNGKECGWAYVDKQAEDAYKISLMGNQGSGRAYYTGRYFNIKGEKTPLATSTQSQFSNGKLLNYDGIWSTLIGNSLHEEFSVKSSPILAILKKTISHCIIIRIDNNASLDRLTHLFYRPIPFSASKLYKVARNLGCLEAEKFIHRILHGAWSAGNTSLDGHLIDYDSMCAVKGRQLQFSYTSKYIDNFFGFELQGQMKNLKSLCDNLIINVERVQETDLVEELNHSFQYHLALGFIYLMGFEDKESLFHRFNPWINNLVRIFCELSHYTYYTTVENLFTNEPSVLFNHLFDFSAFFRIFPILNFNHQFTLASGLNILMKSSRQEKILSEFYAKNELREENIINKFKPYLIDMRKRSSKNLEQKALIFIKNYTSLFNTLQKESINTPEELLARAYVINEDRFYLFPVFSVEQLILDLYSNSLPKLINRFIQNLIKASQRSISFDQNRRYISNFRLFVEGFSHIVINAEGTFTVIFCFYPENFPKNIDATDVWEIKLNKQFISAEYQYTSEGFEVQSTKILNKELITHYTRESSFIIHFYEIYRNGDKIVLTDLFFSDSDCKNYF